MQMHQVEELQKRPSTTVLEVDGCEVRVAGRGGGRRQVQEAQDRHRSLDLQGTGPAQGLELGMQQELQELEVRQDWELPEAQHDDCHPPSQGAAQEAQHLVQILHADGQDEGLEGWGLNAQG